MCLLLLERVDQLDGREEADPLVMMLDGLDAEGGRDMGLAGAGAADQHDVVGVVDELAAMQLAHQRLVDLAAGEVEAGEVAVGREAGSLELVGDRPDLAFGRLGLEQLRQDRNGGFEGRRALFGQLADGLGHAVHLQAPQHDDDGAAGRIMTHGAPPRSSAGHRSVRHWPSARWRASGPVARRWSAA